MTDYLGELLFYAAQQTDEDIKELIKYLKQILRDREK